MAKKDRVANPELRRHVSESRKLIAYGGLHHIKGNRAPYFSLTGAEYEKTRHGIGWQEASGGCIHEALLEQWPDLAPLAALHLSDIDGTPAYVERRKADKCRDIERRASRAVKLDMRNEWQKDEGL